MLATPAKFHYVFNLRDLSRIWQGMLHVTSEVILNESTLLSLWKHECLRVISDRFTEEKDKSWFDNVLLNVCNEEIGAGGMDISYLSETSYFVDFLR